MSSIEYPARSTLKLLLLKGFARKCPPTLERSSLARLLDQSLLIRNMGIKLTVAFASRSLAGTLGRARRHVNVEAYSGKFMGRSRNASFGPKSSVG